jgi:hypothetical protein
MLLAAELGASELRAAEPHAEAASHVVVFSIDSRSKDAPAMIEAVRAHLTGLPVRLVVEHPARGASGASGSPEPSTVSPKRVIGTVTIDPAAEGEWVVSFTEPAFDATLVRRIKVRPQGTLVALEEAAIVIRSMVEALLDGGHVGIAKPAPARSDETPARPIQNGIAVSGGYVGTTFAPGAGWQSGALLGLRLFSKEFYVGGTYTMLPWIETESRLATLVLVRRPGAIVFGYQGSGRIAPTAELAFLADYVWRYTDTIEGGLMKTPAQERWSVGLGLEAGVCWSPLPRMHAVARAGAEVLLNPYSYTVGRQAIVTPSPVRPKVGVGLVIDVW